jgi:hypothetical protein
MPQEASVTEDGSRPQGAKASGGPPGSGSSSPQIPRKALPGNPAVGASQRIPKHIIPSLPLTTLPDVWKKELASCTLLQAKTGQQLSENQKKKLKKRGFDDGGLEFSLFRHTTPPPAAGSTAALPSLASKYQSKAVEALNDYKREYSEVQKILDLIQKEKPKEMRVGCFMSMTMNDPHNNSSFLLMMTADCSSSKRILSTTRVLVMKGQATAEKAAAEKETKAVPDAAAKKAAEEAAAEDAAAQQKAEEQEAAAKKAVDESAAAAAAAAQVKMSEEKEKEAGKAVALDQELVMLASQVTRSQAIEALQANNKRLSHWMRLGRLSLSVRILLRLKQRNHTP